VRYFSEARLSQARTKPLQISGLDASPSLFFVARDEAAQWEGLKFTGLQFGPIYGHRGTAEFGDARLLVPTNVMPEMVPGRNTLVSICDGNESRHTVGFSVYEKSAIESAADFNFTREPTRSYGYANILVSRRFFEFYRQRGLTGWRMRPVLESGTEAHIQFQSTLNAFLSDWSTGHPRNRLVGP